MTKLVRIMTDDVTGEGLYAVRSLNETVDEFESLRVIFPAACGES